MPRIVIHRSCAKWSALLAVCLLAAFPSLAADGAALPFNSATVTKVENKVDYGEIGGATRQVAVLDVVRAKSFLQSEANSRAELQYTDGSLVRLGQNSIFSFEAASRTLSLEKGSLLFHVPKGMGGGTIKTPSLTAAITGTTGKVSPKIIAIIDGVVQLLPSGRLVHAGEFARRNPDGSITIGRYDPAKENDGVLVSFNGLMPGFHERLMGPQLEIPDLRKLESLYRTQNLPGSIQHYFPPPVIRSKPKVLPPPTPAPTPLPKATPPPRKTGGTNPG